MTNPMNEAERVARGLTEEDWATILAMKHLSDTDVPYKNKRHLEEDGGIPERVDSLRRIGLIAYAKGLFDSDGYPYGSGYALTDAGLAVRAHLEANAILAKEADDGE